ncbi:hypothetical protein MTR_5g032350 [Medicago truncatula]|uniref:Uncharacterized protein n=1 Tax=Medicago truncatula TaxID=3880 RepID=G7JXP4_MEDTR|nr:hypothetical protein MTR_5g032350 [Medicago truncatula]
MDADDEGEESPQRSLEDSENTSANADVSGSKSIDGARMQNMIIRLKVKVKLMKMDNAHEVEGDGTSLPFSKREAIGKLQDAVTDEMDIKLLQLYTLININRIAYVLRFPFLHSTFSYFPCTGNPETTFTYFWITDSCPLTVKEVMQRPPFELLSQSSNLMEI